MTLTLPLLPQGILAWLICRARWIEQDDMTGFGYWRIDIESTSRTIPLDEAIRAAMEHEGRA